MIVVLSPQFLQASIHKGVETFVFLFEKIFVGGTWGDYIQGRSRRVRFVNELYQGEVFVLCPEYLTIISENEIYCERRDIAIFHIYCFRYCLLDVMPILRQNFFL